MKFKSLVILMLLLLSCAAVVCAQSPANVVAADKSTAAASAVPETPAPAFKPEDLLKIRDLQYRHAQRAAQMKAMEDSYEKLKNEQDADVQKVDAFINQAAKEANVDLTKWRFDMEDLKLVPRPGGAPPSAPAKAGTPKQQ